MKETNDTNNTIQAFWIALSSLSMLALGLISAMVLSRYFDKENYGSFKQISYVYTTLLFVFSVGLPRVYSYYLPRYSLNEGRGIVFKVTKILFLLGLLFSLFLFFFSGQIADILNNDKLDYGLKVFSPTPFFLLPTLGIEGIFTSYKKTMHLAVYNVITRLLSLSLIILPVIMFESNFLYAIYGWVLASFLTLITAYFFKKIPFRDVEQFPTTLKFKKIFSYSLPLVYASIAGIAISASNQFYISRYFGAEVFAEFANGFIEVPFVEMITLSTSAVLMPVFSKMVYDKIDSQEFVDLWNSVLNKSAIIIYPIVVFCIFNAENFVTILYSDLYIESASYFQIHILLNFFNIIIFAPLIFALGETKYYANVHVFIAVLAWVGNFIIVKTFHSPLAIAIYSTTLSIIKIMILFRFVSKKLGCSIFEMIPFRNLMKILLHSIATIWMTMIISESLHINNLFLKLILISILFFIILIATSSIVGINYMGPLYPVIKKILPISFHGWLKEKY